MRQKPREGMRVKLLADEDNPEEVGTVLSFSSRSGMALVQVDDPYVLGLGDDGIREVAYEDLELWPGT